MWIRAFKQFAPSVRVTRPTQIRIHMGASPSQEPDITPWLQVIEHKLAALRFGSIQVIVHEGRVTQIESTEKFRFNLRAVDESDPGGDEKTSGASPFD